jgi:hypothetical protein
MGVDVRVPVGLMFAVMGALIAGYGLTADHAIYARSLGININAIWGSVMLVTGAILLALSRRPAKRDTRTVDREPEHTRL